MNESTNNDDLIGSQILKTQPAKPAPMVPGIGVRAPDGSWYDVPAETRDTVVPSSLRIPSIHRVTSTDSRAI